MGPGRHKHRGRVSKIAINQNDRVDRGDVLVQLEDNVASARLAAAVAEAYASKHERDAHPITPGREVVTRAEDVVFDARRALALARSRLDEAISNSGARADANQSLPAARKQYSDALRQLGKGRRDLA